MKRITLFGLLAYVSLSLTSSICAQTGDRPEVRALELSTKGDFRGAIAILDETISKNETSFEVYKMRGRLRRMVGDFAGALDDHNKAIELKSDDGELYEQRATLRMYQRQEPALILQDLDAAIAYGRKIEKVYSLRGTIRRQLGDKSGAVADFQAAIGLRPDLARAYLGLAGLYRMDGNDDKAVEVLESFLGLVESSETKTPKARGEVVASSSNVVPISDNKTIITERSVIIREASTRQAPKSLEEMERRTEQLEQSKNTAHAYGSLADIYRKRKAFEKASTLVEKGLKIDPSDFSTREIRGKIRADIGDYVDAVSDFDNVIKLMPNFPSAYLERGIAYLMLGKEVEAQKDFDKFLQLFPNGKLSVEKRVAEARQRLEK